MIEEKVLPEVIDKWVKKAQEGDEASLGQIYDLFFDKIFRYVSFKVSVDSREDVCGEIFLKMVQNIKKYKPQESASFSAWLFRIAHNQIVDFYRKQKELLGIDDDDFFMNIPDTKKLTPDKKTETILEYEKIYESLVKLSSLHREILELKFLEEFSNNEIAKITGKTEGNIRIIQLRALRELRKYFPQEESNF